MNSAKGDIFNRIRGANQIVPATSRESDYAGIERHYRQTPSLPRDEIIDCFIDRLLDYGSNVHRCAQHSIPGTIATVLNDRGIHQILVSSAVPEAWCPEGIGFERDSGLTYEEINTRPAILTRCAAAVALTGSILLSHSEERRALTLIPDYHLCVIFEDQITETVPEAIRQISAFGSAPLTTIAGPSATADIEMTRIKGVHGPRSLDVILAGR